MNKRLGLKVVAVILGIFAWSYVNIIVPPQIKRTVSAPIIYRNKPELMLISPLATRAVVELKGSRRDFIMSGATKISATVDLYNLRPGRALLPIKITASSGLIVVAVSPGQVELQAIPLARKRLPVEVVVKGEPPEGYIAEKPRLNPQNVVIECPGALIDKITSCKVEVSLDRVKNSVSENKVVQILSNTDIPTENIRIIPDKVSIVITVKEGYPIKTVPIASPTFINKPPKGLKLDGFSIIPQNIEITGPPRLLKKIDTMYTEQIDLSLIKRTSVLNLKFISHKSIKTIGSSSMLLRMKDVKVIRTYPGLSFDLKKTVNQFTEVSVASYSMEIEGFTNDLDSIRDDQLKIVLDIQKMKAGKYDVPLSVPAGLPDTLLVKKLSPEKVSILISDLASETPDLIQEKTVSASDSATIEETTQTIASGSISVE